MSITAHEEGFQMSIGPFWWFPRKAGMERADLLARMPVFSASKAWHWANASDVKVLVVGNPLMQCLHPYET